MERGWGGKGDVDGRDDRTPEDYETWIHLFLPLVMTASV